MWKVKIIGIDWKEYLRQPCQVYTRVMGYLRPVSHYNIGKKSEFYDRKYFIEWKSCPRYFDSESQRVNAMLQDNKDFISKYIVNETQKQLEI